MAAEYSVEVCRKLEQKVEAAQLYRPRRIERYEEGTELAYDVTSVEGAVNGRVSLVVEKFIGGGFAGQVYRVKVTNIEAGGAQIGGLEVGGVYAMKILVPPSGFSRLFRNVVYWMGFQGPFQLQVNPAAARAGALWQKFIRRAARIRFGGRASVVDIHAMFVDEGLGSCGELSEWVDGRTWRLEVDDNLDTLARWRKGESFNEQKLGSPEYRTKREFMADFVKLLHDMGGYEVARQYEWSTCKSQPNCLKRKGTDADPMGGLVAVDFRAGLALLPFLPMSPGDFKLIVQGVARGSLVQFDRGSLKKLEAFIGDHGEDFADMGGMLKDLKECERIYRDSVPDIAHNHIRLLYSGRLWSTILSSAITGWHVRNLVDEESELKLQNCKASTLLFWLIGIIPLLGKFIRLLWARPDWRKHYLGVISSWDYFGRAVRARIAEKVTNWYRAGRADEARALRLSGSIVGFVANLPLSILPAGLHRFLTDSKFFREKLAYIFVRPVRLYFNRELREQWLRDMVADGRRKQILTDEDAAMILSRLDEPYIQRYLVSLVVHLLTLPVTQIVSGGIAAWFWFAHPDMSVEARTAAVTAILVAFQIVPISPGSMARGLYTTGLVIHERNFKDYNIALFLSYFKYIGYLAFPIQMTYHYPAMARFMAGHWATEVVHIVPVFGEHGALLEHWVFRLFYNWPLTIRRRISKRIEMRKSQKARYWHILPLGFIAGCIPGAINAFYAARYGVLLSKLDMWWLWLVLPLVLGMAATRYCGGAALWKRFIAATVCGVLAGIVYSAIVAAIAAGYEGPLSGLLPASEQPALDLVKRCTYGLFALAVLSTTGAIVGELKQPDPDIAR